MRFLGTKCLMAQALSQALQNLIQQYRRIILQFGKIIEKKSNWSIRKQFQSVRQNALQPAVCLQKQCKMDESLMLSWTWFCVRSNSIIHSKTSLGEKQTKLMSTPLRSRLKKDLKKGGERGLVVRALNLQAGGPGFIILLPATRWTCLRWPRTQLLHAL